MYNHHTVSFRARCLLISLLLTVSGCSSAPTAITFSEPAELTPDGLRLLDATVMNKVWAREDLDLRRYRSFMTIDGGFHYKPVENRDTEFALTDEQKSRLESLVNEEFDRALSKVTTLQRVTEPGQDVLAIKGGLLNIVSRIPPDKPGRVDYVLSNTGQATFVVEVIDSTTGDVLIRAIDTRAAGSEGTSELSNRATNASNARRLASRWANLIANDLNTITTLPVLRD